MTRPPWRKELSVGAAAAVACLLSITQPSAEPQGRGAPPAPQTPARDSVRVSMSGTASMSGTVTSDDEAKTPLRRVSIWLQRSHVDDSRSTSTDDTGRYLFERLPAGTYSLSATKGAYVTAVYGATAVSRSGSPIPLADGQRFEARPMTLTRGGVIAGQLTNPKGRPLAGTQVEALQFQVVNGERRRRPSGSTGYATTDSRGMYRIYGLAAGEYLVSANARSIVSNDVRELTAAEIQWARQQVTGAGSGAPAAPGRVAATERQAPPAGGPAFVYAPTFYPSTADPSTASVIVLGRAEEKQGIDFQVQYVPTARIAGVVIGTDGRPAPDVVLVRVSRAVSPLTSTMDFGGSARTGPDGKFGYAGVPPGEYTITARTGGAEAGARGRGAGPARSVQWGLADVTVQGEDLLNLNVQLQPALTLEGSVVFAGTALSPPSDLSRVQPRLQAQTSGPTVTINATPTGVDPDGTFTIADVTPGRYLMTALAPVTPGAANNWILKSATLAGNDILDLPFEIAPGRDVTGVVLTFSDQQTELTGTLMDSAGQPAPQFFVIAFAADRKYWTTGSRWIKSARAGVNGSFKITALPPGEYHIAALTEIDNAQLFDPAYLELFIPASFKLTLGEGEKRVQDLKVGG